MINQDRIRNLLPAIALVLLLFAAIVNATCPAISGTLRGLEHDVAGTLFISKDCTMSLNAFSYDGLAPQVYFWAAPDCNAGTLKKQGERISDQQLEKSYNNGQFSVPLFQNIEWSDIGCISVYCEEFFANMGDLSFTPVDAQPQTAEPSGNTTPTPSPSAITYESVDDLSSCTELIPGYFNLHWQIDDATNTLLLGFEGRPGTSDTWLGFGFSQPGAPGPEMVGSGVVVAGMVEGKCFAYPYFLSAQSQCDFATADGVCPDFAGTTPLVPTTAIDVLSCEKKGDKLSVLMAWPLDSSGAGWPTDGSRYSIYAIGPISEGSNSTIPVVLYHNIRLPGTSATESITSSSDNLNPLKINLSTVKKNCRTIVPNTSTAPSNAPAPGPAASGGTVATIDGPTTFTITIGSNKNYPNPPAWGYSLWVNNKESPVVVVRRGTTYTFNIEAGPTHPVYITSSIIGGGLLVEFEDEIIFAGNDTTFGAPGKAVKFTWTPDEKTPDLVYYQCVVHQKLGWEIRVVDAGVGSVAGVGAAPAPALVPADDDSSSKSTKKCSVTTEDNLTLYNACIPLDGVGESFNMAWNLDPFSASANDISTGSYYELSMGINATSTGWVSVAFPKIDGQMIGSSAMVLKTCATCVSGAEISEYSLDARTVSGVTPGTVLNPTDLEASFSDGMLAGKFKIKVPMGDGSRRRRQRRQRSLLALDSAPSDFPLIFAAGDLSSNGNLQLHDTFGSSSLDISVGLVSQGDTSDSNGLSAPVAVEIETGFTNTAARTAHMWLTAVGFGVLIPIGIVIARFWSPPKSSTGFQTHRALQTFGFLLGVAGIVCGFIAGGGWSSKYQVHRNIGMAVIVLCFVQMFSLVWRPKIEDTLRRPWALSHRWLGRAVAILAISNIYYGIIHVASLGTWAWATYTAILGVILLVALGKESLDCARGKGANEIDTSNIEKERSSTSSTTSLKNAVHTDEV